MNIRIDITISKEFTDEEIEEYFGGSYETTRELEIETMYELLTPMLDEGYKIVMNSVVEK